MSVWNIAYSWPEPTRDLTAGNAQALSNDAFSAKSEELSLF